MEKHEKNLRDQEHNRGHENKQQEKVDTNINRGSNKGDTENLSSNQGGTTDLGAEGRGTQPSRATGSGLGTKTAVTGSDYDGQVG